MQGYGVPYTVVRVDPAAEIRANFTTLLYQEDGTSPRYGGIIM